MTKQIYILLLICIGASLLFAGAVVKDFHGEAGFNLVTLKWIVTAEIDLKGYQILRSFDGTSFSDIAFIKSKSEEGGEKSYTYIDRSVFKTEGRTCYYKLRMVNLSDETTTDYEQVVTVSPQISATRHTWGSIKAMFR
jgi:hypothetical protein